ncbi:MAG: helix-hairpin-helix domain-containing protein [Acidimicrobiales bacterium]
MPDIPTRPDDTSSAPTPWRDRLDALGQGERGPLRLAGLVAAAALVGVLAVVALRPPPAPPELTLPVAGPAGGAAAVTTTTGPVPVVAHAAGAVREPGVYRLPPGARVAELVEAAGGAAESADLDRLNLAAPLSDGQRVYVPRAGEPVPVPEEGDGPTPAGDDGTVVDLNSAGAGELEALPGVGPAIARAILDERERRGRFTSVEQLIDVRGIGEAKLAQLRDLVRVRG